VDEVGGVVILAHPFRKWWLSLPSDSEWEAKVQEACRLPVWDLVDAVEIYNGLCQPRELRFALEVAPRIGKKTTGGSDTHRVMEAARSFTVFQGPVSSERELIEALKDGGIRGSNWASEGLPEGALRR